MNIDFELPGIDVKNCNLINKSAYSIYIPKSKIAKQLSGYKQIKLDLMLARDSFFNIQRLAECQENYLLKHGLWFMGTMYYARCFASADGRGVKLEENKYISDLGSDLQSVHKELIDQRNQYFAHAGNNDIEHFYILAVLNPDINNKSITGLSNIFDRTFCINNSKSVAYLDVTKKIIAKVVNKENEVASALIKELESLNLDQIYKESLPPNI